MYVYPARLINLFLLRGVVDGERPVQNFPIA